MSTLTLTNKTITLKVETVDCARNKGSLPLTGQYTPRNFIISLQRPRSVIILVKASAPVDHTITTFSDHLDPDDCIIHNDNEWYENIEHYMNLVADKGLLYLSMGVSSGKDNACHDPP
ncbi:hypothetical protein JHK82_040392 [Glycine max]|nr:hypothetical protein JHK82_040392 [Glycine max]